MKIATIIGARPQFIKAAPVSRAIAEHNHLTEIIIHTGQHFDANMSDVFFSELDIPRPDYNLGINSASHGTMTGRMLEKIEEILIKEKPDSILVYGDTNSTLAGALAAVKLYIPVAHVEAGLRSFNREMPEEHNRVLTDHCSDLLFCPTQTAVNNLTREGITQGVHLVGDVMYDSVLYNIHLAETRSHILEKLKLKPKNYALATIHRAENTDNLKRLESIFSALEKIAQDGLPVIIPLHPRTRRRIAEFGLANPQSAIRNLQFLDPVSYLDMLLLEKNSQVIFTDSGGVQKEAYWFGVPCVTLREETEWVELVEQGCNVLAGSDTGSISRAYTTMTNKTIPAHLELYGNGDAGRKIVEALGRVP